MQAGLYLHIPFCQSKCRYCDFYSVAAQQRLPEFLVAIKQEMAEYKDFWPSYDTLYFGGGTPSLIKLSDLADLLNHLTNYFSLAKGAEWTIEANPDDLTLLGLKELRSLGFNRLSLGVQSLNDHHLAWLGRRHTSSQAKKAIEHARQAGFENLSIDLIYGLPKETGSTPASWLKELQEALVYQPEHLSCYQLSIEAHTPLAKEREKGLWQPLNKEEEAQYFLKTSLYLEAAGYYHYEVSNFCRGGMGWASGHNQKYWQHLPYLGLGPAAHSFRSNRRHWNHRSLTQYCRDLLNGALPLAGEEQLGQDELRLETLYFGFRTRAGLHLPEFQRHYGQNLLHTPPGLADRLIQEKVLKVEGEYLVPTRSGLAVADALALLW